MPNQRIRSLGCALLAALVFVLLPAFLDPTDFRVYLPDELPRSEPDWPNGEPAVVATVTEDGLTLKGRYWPAENPNSQRLILYFHGNKGHVVKAAEYAEGLRPIGDAILVADYRGYSDNPGTPSEAGLFADGRAFVKLALQMGYAPENIFVVGLSLGSAVSLAVAATEPIAGVVVMSAFTRLDDLVPRSIAKRMNEHFDNLARVPHIPVPKVFIQGTFDAVVVPDHGRQLYLAAREPAALVVLDSVFHRPPMSKAREIIAAAIEGIAAGDLGSLDRLEKKGLEVFVAPDRDVPALGEAGARGTRNLR